MAQVSACCSRENELRLLAQIDEPPYDVTQQSAQRGPLGDTWYNHLGISSDETNELFELVLLSNW